MKDNKELSMREGKKNFKFQDIVWEHCLNGADFEKQIGEVLDFALRYEDNAQIEHTGQSGDRGTDFIITIKGDIYLFYKKFLHNPIGDSEHTYIFVEIKHRAGNNLSANDFANSLLRNHEAKKQPSYLILITDSYVSAESHFRALIDTSSKGYEFFLVDRYALLHFLKHHEKGHSIDVPNKITPLPSISIKHSREDYNNENSQEICRRDKQAFYLQIRNNTIENVNVNIYLQTDRYSTLSNGIKKDLKLAPMEIVLRKYLLVSKQQTLENYNINIDGEDIILRAPLKTLTVVP